MTHSLKYVLRLRSCKCCHLSSSRLYPPDSCLSVQTRAHDGVSQYWWFVSCVASLRGRVCDVSGWTPVCCKRWVHDGPRRRHGCATADTPVFDKRIQQAYHTCLLLLSAHHTPDLMAILNLFILLPHNIHVVDSEARHGGIYWGLEVQTVKANSGAL